MNQLHAANPNQLAFKLIANTFNPRKEVDQDIKGYTSSGIFNRYVNATAFACPKHIELAENHLEGKGTRKIYDHPFWEVIKFKSENIQDLYFLLSQLRPEITNLLFECPSFMFDPPLNYKKKFKRKSKKNIWSIFKKLQKESDIDAITAAIGLIIENRYTQDDPAYSEYYLSEKLFHFFKCAISFYPLNVVAPQLFQYVKENFLYERMNEKIYPYVTHAKTWNQYLDSFNIEVEVEKNQRIYAFLEDAGAIKHYVSSPSSYLYLTDTYLTTELKEDIFRYVTYEDFIRIKNNEQIKKMLQNIKQWERRLVKKRKSKTTEKPLPL